MSIQAILDGHLADRAQGAIATASGQKRLAPVKATLQEYTPAHAGHAAACFELRGMTAGIAPVALDQVCAAIANVCDGKMVPVRETLRRVSHSAIATVVTCHLAPKPVSYEFQSVEQATQHGFIAQAKNLFLNPGEAKCYTVSESNGRVQVSRASDLDTDELLSLGLTRLFEIIGEAAAHVSDTVRAKHPDIPWSQMIGMRNRLIHGYDIIDADVIWQTVTEDLPLLVKSLEKIVEPK